MPPIFQRLWKYVKLNFDAFLLGHFCVLPLLNLTFTPKYKKGARFARSLKRDLLDKMTCMALSKCWKKMVNSELDPTSGPVFQPIAALITGDGFGVATHHMLSWLTHFQFPISHRRTTSKVFYPKWIKIRCSVFNPLAAFVLPIRRESHDLWVQTWRR